MGDITHYERPNPELFDQCITAARALAALADNLESAAANARPERDAALDVEAFQGPWGAEFRKRAEEDDINVRRVVGRLRNDAGEWGRVWQQAAIQTNNIAYAEAVLLERDRIKGDRGQKDSHLQAAFDNWLADGGDPTDVVGFAELHGTVAVSLVKDGWNSVRNLFGGKSPIGEAFDNVARPSSVKPSMPNRSNGFATDGQAFVHYDFSSQLTGHGPAPGQPVYPAATDPDVVDDATGKTGNEQPDAAPEDPDGAHSPDPVLVSDRDSLGADTGTCSINLDLIDTFLGEFDLATLMYPGLHDESADLESTLNDAFGSLGEYGAVLSNRLGPKAFNLYASSCLPPLVAAVLAVRTEVGADASGVIEAKNVDIANVLKKYELDKAPGLVEVQDPEFHGIDPNSGFVDDPICAANGNFVYEELDLPMPGSSSPIALRRTYNSGSRRVGAFGRGWSSLVDVRVELGDRTGRIRLDDGAVIAFVFDDNDTATTNVRNISITRADDQIRAVIGNGVELTFDGSGTLVAGRHETAEWTLRRQHDRFVFEEAAGRSLTLVVDQAGLVQTAVTSDGRTATFVYDDSFCSRVERPAGAIAYGASDDGLLESVTDADGVVIVRNVFDDDGRALAQTNEFGRVSEYEYDEAHGVMRVREAASGSIVNALIHDASANLLSVASADGFALRQTWDEQRRRTSVTDRRGLTTSFAYVADAVDDLISSITLPDGSVERRTWDDSGRLRSVIDAEGGETIFDYEADSVFPSRVTDPEGRVLAFNRDARALPTSIVDADGVATSFEWDRDGQPTTISVGNRTAHLAYDDAGELVRVTDGDGYATSFVVDAAGRVIESNDGATVHRFEYSAAGRVLSDRSNGVLQWQREYGTHGEIVKRVDALGLATEFDYDDTGNCVEVRLPTGDSIGSRYNAMGQASELLLGSTVAATIGYDANGQWVSVIDADGVSVRRELDEFDRTKRMWKGDTLLYEASHHITGRPRAELARGVERSYETDKSGRVVAIDDANGRTELSYTAAGRLASRRSPAGRTTAFDYDDAGSLSGVDRGDGQPIEITSTSTSLLSNDPRTGERACVLDAREQLVGWRSPNGSGLVDRRGDSVVVHESGRSAYVIGVDPLGQITEVTDSSGAVTEIERDELGRITRASGPDEELRFTHRLGHGMTSMTSSSGESATFGYSPGGRVTEIRLGDVERLVIARDANGEVSGVSADDISLVTVERDEFGRLSSIGGQASTARFAYDATNMLSEVVDGAAGVARYVRDRDGLVERIESSAGHTIELVRDDAGRTVSYRSGGLELDEVTEPVPGRRNAAQQLAADERGGLYRYDGAGRLAEHLGPDGDRSTFEYTPSSMIRTESTPELGDREFGYSGARLATVRAAAGETRCYYDHRGRRVREAHPDSAETHYVWNALDQLVEIRRVAADGNTTTRKLDYSGQGQVLVADGETAIHWDHGVSGKVIGIGDRRFVRSATRFAEIGVDDDWRAPSGFDAYGYSAELATGIDLGFRGELTIDGLVFMGARVYDPVTRCFLTRDPADAVPFRPGGANPYNYCWADPVNNIDPTGLRPISVDEFDDWRDEQQRSRLASLGHAMASDVWGTVAFAAVVVGGAALIVVTGGAAAVVGGAMLLTAAYKLADGFANKNFEPRRATVDVAISGAAAYAAGALGGKVANLAAKGLARPVGSVLPRFAGHVASGTASSTVEGTLTTVANQTIDANGNFHPDRLDLDATFKSGAQSAVLGMQSSAISFHCEELIRKGLSRSPIQKLDERWSDGVADGLTDGLIPTTTQFLNGERIDLGGNLTSAGFGIAAGQIESNIKRRDREYVEITSTEQIEVVRIDRTNERLTIDARTASSTTRITDGDVDIQIDTATRAVGVERTSSTESVEFDVSRNTSREFGDKVGRGDAATAATRTGQVIERGDVIHDEVSTVSAQGTTTTTRTESDSMSRDTESVEVGIDVERRTTDISVETRTTTSTGVEATDLAHAEAVVVEGDPDKDDSDEEDQQGSF